VNYDKLKDAINERRKWNMEHLLFPNLVNNGLVQALALIDSIDRKDGVTFMGSPMIAYSRKRIREIAKDKKNYIRKSDNGGFLDVLKPLGCDGDIVDVVYPDGTEELCIEESVADMMCEAMGRAMLENGTLTQEEYEEYIDDPFIYDDEEDYKLEFDSTESNGDNVVPLFKPRND